MKNFIVDYIGLKKNVKVWMCSSRLMSRLRKTYQWMIGGEGVTVR